MKLYLYVTNILELSYGTWTSAHTSKLQESAQVQLYLPGIHFVRPAFWWQVVARGVAKSVVRVGCTVSSTNATVTTLHRKAGEAAINGNAMHGRRSTVVWRLPFWSQWKQNAWKVVNCSLAAGV